ncbi:serine/threonine protein phosphatase [Qipengyuania sp. 1NDW9]|uniref:metallophosphoesterase family protein n=1 Tax=Qipengyuania xiapuensis TaxID=2867236 RepID=UPI001C867118|nr:metallophosphoesterase family protein [Qipengyuania xiapuensis]MBX7492251.1 serine/threonine protein phosphatase [Qipengyuania xiapuensis]
MLDSIRKIFGLTQPERRIARAPEGERWYVIGDVHGRKDLLEALKVAIEDDDAEAGEADTTVVFLGDLVDRGPDSAGVIKLARKWGKERKVRYLAGNHEEMFLQSFDDKEVLRHFLKHGGRETVLSYGMKRKEYNKLKVSDLQEAMHDLVPKKDREFLESFEEMIVVGDYVLAHAGINPARPIDEQKRSDLLWIRERFLRHKEPFSHVVVHGHTIFEAVEDQEHRIGIDTGAFRTGRLTAMVIEGDRRRTIQAVADEDGAISIEKVDA